MESKAAGQTKDGSVPRRCVGEATAPTCTGFDRLSLLGRSAGLDPGRGARVPCLRVEKSTPVEGDDSASHPSLSEDALLGARERPGGRPCVGHSRGCDELNPGRRGALLGDSTFEQPELSAAALHEDILRAAHDRAGERKDGRPRQTQVELESLECQRVELRKTSNFEDLRASSSPCPNPGPLHPESA